MDKKQLEVDKRLEGLPMKIPHAFKLVGAIRELEGMLGLPKEVRFSPHFRRWIN